MKKLILCRTATILCGLLAITIHARPDMIIGHSPNHKLMGGVLGLLSAIFGTQWVEYRKRQDAVSTQPGWPAWVRRLLFSCLLGLTGLSTNAQTNWTTQHQSPNRFLSDIAYGAGRYVAVGGEGGGFLRISEDGNTWMTLPSSELLIGIVYAAGKFVVVGSNGTVRTSTDGLTWVTQVSGTDKYLSSITYGGGQFMAVGDEGTSIVSPDGVTWTTLTTGTTVDLYDVVYGGSQFVIVDRGGGIRTTPNGIIWTTRTSGVNEGLVAITVGKNGLFVAVGFSSEIVTSPDGITWTPRSAPGFGDLLTGVACDLTTGQFVATSYHSNEVLTSPDGITWSLTYSGTQLNLAGVRFINGRFVAVGDFGSIRSSLNGTAWKPLTIDYDTNLNGVAYGNGHYVAVGRYPISNHPAIGSVAITSTDGAMYTLGKTEHFSGAGEGFSDVAFGAGQFVAVGGEAIIQTSVDGNDWTLRHSSLGASLNGVAYGGGQYVAVGTGLGPGSAGNFVRSTDGITWTTGSVGMNTYYHGITYANGQFMAVGDNGVIGTSPDGSTWTARTSGTTKLLKSVAYGNGTYVAVGVGGTALRSADGITWTAIAGFTPSDINHVTFDNGQFVTAGEDGELFTSSDVTTWTQRSINSDGYTLNGIVHGNGQFVAVGTGALIGTSPDNGIQPPASDFSIMGVTMVSCQSVTDNRRQIVFSPQYKGLSGQPVSLSVVNEMLPTTNAGPYSLGMYIDNPTITLKATQSGTPGEATFTYNWLAACAGVPPGNQLPVAPFIGGQSGTVNQVFTQTLPPFTDPEGLTLTYKVAGLPSGLMFTAPATISGTPTTQGVSIVTVTATDPGNLSNQTTYTITINPVGNPGSFAIKGVTLVSCQTVTDTRRQLVFSPQYEGLSGQPVSFSVVNEMLPTTNAGPYALGMYIDNPTIMLKATQSGTSGEVSFTYNWLAACAGVPPGNQPPVAPSIADASGTVGQVYSQSIPAFSDPEGQALTYSVTGLPAGLLVINGGNIVGPPSISGIYLITITATDPGGLSASATYTLTINPAGSNPSTLSITGVTLVSCQTVTDTRRQLVFSPQYEGLSGQPVSFSVVNEMLPTTNAGPYALGMYIDNPTITLKATQSGTLGEASFTYNWLAACQTNGARIGRLSSVETLLEVRVLGNPVVGSEAAIEIRGAAGQTVEFKLMDLQGKALHSQRIDQASPLERVLIPVDSGSNILLLEVSTTTERKLIRLVKP